MPLAARYPGMRNGFVIELKYLGRDAGTESRVTATAAEAVLTVAGISGGRAVGAAVPGRGVQGRGAGVPRLGTGARRRGGVRRRWRPSRLTRRRGAGSENCRCGDVCRAAGRDSAGGGQGGDRSAGAVRVGLRHVHAALPGGAGGDRAAPETVRDRPRRRSDRRFLAQRHARRLLAQRAGAEQRGERRGDGAVGHQGQGGRAALLPALGRAQPRHGGGVRARQRQRAGRGARPGAGLLGARLPPHPLPARRLRRGRRRNGQQRGRRVLRRRRAGFPVLRSGREAAPGAGAVRDGARRPAGGGGTAVRHPRAAGAGRRGAAGQGAGAVPAVLPGGRAGAGRPRLLPHAARPVRGAAGDGRVVRAPAGGGAAGHRAADRLRARARVHLRRHHRGPEAGQPVRGVRGTHRLARPARRVAGRHGRQRAPGPARGQLRHPGVVVPRPRRGGPVPGHPGGASRRGGRERAARAGVSRWTRSLAARFPCDDAASLRPVPRLADGTSRPF